MINKPPIEEVPAFYRGYVHPLPSSDIEGFLQRQTDEFVQWLGLVPREKHHFRYAEGKWSVAEVLGHIIDTERVFAYRIICIARGEQGPLPGFDQDAYVDQGRFDNRDFYTMVDEFRYSRYANLLLINSLDDLSLVNVGNANGADMSISTIVYIMAGHLHHHLNIFKEKYQL